MLSADQKAKFERDGVLFPLDVLEAAEVRRYREAIEGLERRAGGPLSYVGHPHSFFPWAFDLAREPAILDVVQDLLGPDLLISATLILCKQPRSAGFAAWHQDGRYDGPEPEGSLSAWVALTPSRRESGCMRVIPGSQREGPRPHDETWRSDSLLKRGVELRVHPDERLAVDVELEPGQMSLHHNLIVHGSLPNGSDAKRLGFIIRYSSPLAVTGIRGRPLTLGRGRPLPGQWVTDRRPPDDDAGAFARWQDSLSAASS